MKTHEWLDDAERSEYIKFLGQTDIQIDDRIRRATSTGRPLGDEQFLKKIERKLSRRLVPGKAGRPRTNKK